MRNLLLIFLLARLGFVTHAAEITTTFEVTLNGQKFSVNAEASINVMVDGKELKLSACEKPEKTFSDSNISFAFPATHAVTKEVADTVTTWTLDGQDNVLILMKMKGVNPSEVGKETVQALRKQYGAKSKVSNCSITLGSETVIGKKITAVLVGELINQEVYELLTSSDGYILIIQDSGESESAETRAAKSLLKQSFKRTAVPTPKQSK